MNSINITFTSGMNRGGADAESSEGPLVMQAVKSNKKNL